MAYIGNRPVSGDNNSFRVLDDIKTHTFSFDGSSSSVVSTSDNTITHLGHRLVQGQRVTYTDGTGSAIGGLTDGTVYFVIMNDANSFKLASSASNAAAGTAVNLSALGSGTAHNITVAFDGVNTKFKATFNNGTEADVTRVAQIQISLNNVIQQPQNTPTPTSGFGFESDSVIVFASAPASTVTFWGVLFANNFPTFEISDNEVDNFTGDGSTTDFTLSKSPASNENIIVTIDGVVQYPSDNSTTRAYNTVANTLQFSAAPADGADIQVRHIGFAGPDESGGVTAFYGRTGSVFLNNSDNIVVNDAEVTGNLTVQGTMTTLDTKVTEVDQLEVAANNTTVGVAITQSGSGDILNLYDGSTEVFTVQDGGKFGFGTGSIDERGQIEVSSGTCRLKLQTGNAAVAGFVLQTSAIRFDVQAQSNFFQIYDNTVDVERLRIDSAGKVGVNSISPTSRLDVVGDAKITGIVTAASFVGALPITNDADNRIITASGSGGLNAEGGLLYDGTYFTHTGSGYKQITASTTTNNSVQLKLQNSVKNFSITNVAGGVFQLAEGPTSRFKLQDGVSFLDSTVGVGTNTLTNLGNSQVNIEGTAALTNHNQTLIIRDSVADDATGRGGNIGFGAYVDGTMRTLAAIGASKKNSGTGFDGNLAFYTRRNGVGPVDERMLIHSEGRVEITGGDDQDNFEINVNSSQFAVHTDDSDGEISLRAQDGAGGTNSKYMTFFTQATGQSAIERFRITESGEIRIANGGLLTIKTAAAATYGISEALRIDDNNVTNDRAFQIFEYQNAGGRWFSLNQNLNVTTTGSSYTYTQGNYGGSNMFQIDSGDLRIYSDPSIVSGGTSAITPTERIRVKSDGKVLIGSDFNATPYDDRKFTVSSTSNNYISIQSGDSSFSGIVFGHNSGQNTDNFLTYVRHYNANNSFNIHTNSQPTPKITITSAGDVGIGSESPQAKLDVNGSLNVSGVGTFSERVTCKNLLASFDGNTGISILDTGHGFSASTIGISNGGRDLAITAPRDIRLKPSDGLNGIVIENNGAVELYHANNLKAATSASGFNVTGNISCTGTVDINADLDISGNVGIGTNNPGELLVAYKTSNDAVIKVRTTTAGAYFVADSASSGFHGLSLSSSGTDKWFLGSYATNNFQIKDGSGNAGDARFTIQDGTGRVGIGTDNPQEILHVLQSGTTAAEFRLENNEGYLLVRADNNIATYGAQQHLFHNRANSTEYLRITSDGEVGIGSDDPHRTLVLKTGNGDIHCLDGNGGIYMGTDNSGGFQKNCAIARAGANNYHIAGSTPGDLCIAGESGQSMIFGVSPFAGGMDTFLHVSRLRNFNLYGTDYKFHIGSTERFNIKNNGNIGIGTIDATSKVHIGPLNGDTSHHVYLSSGNNDYGFLIDVQDYGSQNVPLRIFNRRNNNDTEVVRITQDGDVGIGTVPDEKFHVRVTSSTATVAKFERTHANNASIEYKNSTSRMFAGLAGDALGWGVDDDANIGHEPMFIVRRTTGKVGIGIANPDELLHIFSASGSSKIVLEADNNSANNGIYWVDEGDNTQSEFYYDHGGNKQHLNVNGNGLEIYSKQTSKVTAKIGHGSGYNDVVVPNGKLGVGTDNAGTTLDVFGFLQVKDSTGKLSMQMDGANGNFKVFQSPPSWTSLTYNPNPILAWDFKSGPGDLFYIASGGNTPQSSQMALVVSDNHGFKVGKSGYNGSDFDVDSNNEFFRIDTSGNVLIGNSLTAVNNETTGTLIVDGGDSNIGGIQVHAGGGESDGDLSGISFSHGNSGTAARPKAAIALRKGTGGYGKGDLCFYVDGANDNNAVSAGDEKLRITNDGTLEIERGSSTDQAIDIKSTATTGACRIRFMESGSAKGELAYSHNNDQLELVGRSGQKIALFTDGTAKLTISTGGQLNLAGNMQFTVANPELEFNNGGPRFRVPAANTLAIHNGGTLGSTNNEVARIHSDGSIGISSVTTASNATGVIKYMSGTSRPDNAVGGITVRVDANTISGDITLPRLGHIMAVTSFTDVAGTDYPQPSGAGLIYVDVGPSKSLTVITSNNVSGNLRTVNSTITNINSASLSDNKVTFMPGSGNGTIRIANKWTTSPTSTKITFYLTFM